MDLGQTLGLGSGTGTALGAGAGFYFGGPMGAAVGAQLGGAVDGMFGAKDANRQNKEMSEAQMQFQERMSSTAHQREILDLKTAGLNPLLSSTGGASSPSGSQATMQNIASGLSSSAADIANIKLQREQIALQTERQKEEIKTLQAQRQKTNTETRVLAKDIPKSDLINQGYDYIKKKFNEFQKSNSQPEPQYKFEQKPIQLNPRKG